MSAETRRWVREFRAALKAQSREALARLKTLLGDKSREKQDRALAAILAMVLPKRP
jgi:hypothetical protein